MSKSKGIKVSFGHNAENVTGSYTLIECGISGKKILVDYGLIQENVSLLKEYQMNIKRPDFKPREIDYIFITHAHQDHSGRIGQLYKYGCEAPILLPEGSREVYKAMLLDGANISLKDAEDLTRQLKKEYEPLYTEDDVMNTLGYIEECKVGEKIKLDDDIEFKMTYNGHIFKSVSITFWIKNGAQTKKIIVTGDIGNLSNKQKFTPDFIEYENCNLLVGECTYGSERRSANGKVREKDLEKIKASIDTTCIDRKGRVLIPTFAFGRSPAILATLYDLYYEDSLQGKFDVPIIYASPLGVKLLKIFQNELDKKESDYLTKVLSWKNIKILSSFTELEKEIKEGSPKIFCLPSGMMTAGYSTFAAENLLPHTNDLIMFCGYSTEGSLAWKIKQKKTKTISINGKSIHSRCQVTNLTSFSSHAQYWDLLDIYSEPIIDKIALVHGNFDTKADFANDLAERLSKRNKSSKVIIVNKNTTINL